MPTEAMLRTISASDSSNAKYIARSPRRHAASQNCAASVDLPVPARAADEDGAALVVAAVAEHGVEAGHARGDPLARDAVLEARAR